MHVVDAPAPGALMQVIDILGTEKERPARRDKSRLDAANASCAAFGRAARKAVRRML